MRNRSLDGVPLKPGNFDTIGYMINSQSPSPPYAQKRKMLMADKNTANGGIGISYSNVVLSGGLNPNRDNNLFIAKRDAEFKDPRSVRANTEMTAEGRNNVIGAVGIHPSQKYDFNIVNGQTFSGAGSPQSLSNAKLAQPAL